MQQYNENSSNEKIPIMMVSGSIPSSSINQVRFESIDFSGANMNDSNFRHLQGKSGSTASLSNVLSENIVFSSNHSVPSNRIIYGASKIIPWNKYDVSYNIALSDIDLANNSIPFQNLNNVKDRKFEYNNVLFSRSTDKYTFTGPISYQNVDFLANSCNLSVNSITGNMILTSEDAQRSYVVGYTKFNEF
jgi:hypothetical protein